MASANEAHAVKSLNTTPGRRNRRFVFKSSAQRIDELEIDVFRNLDTVKAEPSSGSSFFLDCLIHWRELNTAEDFISFYEELMPLVQTLPLVLLHKDMIITRLLSRLQMKARLSLEAILRLIAELSRDLLEDFIPFLPKIIESYMVLLRDGADQEPEIIEQIFTSWSYIMMYLQKYLIQDVLHILKVTVKLRYYPKDFVGEYMAEAMSFLMRNAPFQQLRKGVTKILHEAARKPSQSKKSGASALLWHIMRGTSSRFHSRACQVLSLLTHNDILSIDDKFNQGSDTVTEIVITAFERCMELNLIEMKLIWDCLYKAIADSVSDRYSQHLSRLLSVLISTMSVDRGRKVSDYQKMQKLVELLMGKFILPYSSGETKGLVSEAVDKTFQLMLCVLDGIYNKNNSTGIPEIAFQWAPVFQLRSLSLLTFLKELVLKEYVILAFRNNILSGWLNVLEKAKGEALHLILAYCERFQVKTGCFNVLEGMSEEVVVQSRCFFQEAVRYWIGVLNSLTHRDMIVDQVDEDNLALLWGIICCIPYFLSAEENEFLMDLVDVVDQLLVTKEDAIAGVPKRIWQGLIGAALHSYCDAGRTVSFELKHTSRFMRLGKSYKSSQQVLSAVADYLDSIYGTSLLTDSGVMMRHPKLEAAELMDALDIFSGNLYNPNKELRISTLRILCHYERLDHASQQMGKGVSAENHVVTQSCNVFNLLLSIEQTPISVTTSRKLTLLVSRIQTFLSAPEAPEVYVLPAFYGVIGLLYNHYTDLSNSALECLSTLIHTYPGLLWKRFISFFEQCQISTLKTRELDNPNMESCSETTDLVEHFRSFCGTVSCDSSGSSILSLLLQVFQRIPTITESHSRQIVPLFLRFMGYKDENSCLESFDSHDCRGREWKVSIMEWLNLLKLLKNPKSFYRSQLLKEVLVNRLLDDNDAEIQTRVLDCLLNWKDSFLLPYEKQLKNLVSSKCLREELATWSLSEESNLVENEHRSQLVPLVIRLLMPKVRSLKTLASRKHASVSNRKAVLGFIAQLSVSELPLFFQLLMNSLQIADLGSDGTENCAWIPEKCNVNEFESSSLLSRFSMEKILAIPIKKRYGFLHVVEEIFRIFDASRVCPFLDLLLGCVVRVLESCAASIPNRSNKQPAQLDDSSEVCLPEGGKEAMSHTSLAVKQYKDMRSLCLKIISLVLNKYEDHDFGSTFWDIFFKAVKPLVDGFKQEGSSSEKPSSLFFCFLAMSQSPKLVSLLCREDNLIPDIFSILSVPTASEAIVYSVLKFTENLLTLEVELGSDRYVIKDVLYSNLEGLVDSLHQLFHSFAERKRKLRKHPGETVLRVLKFLSKFVKEESAAIKFVDILLLLVSDGIKNSDVCIEALQILRDIVPALQSEANTKILKAVSPILISAQRGVRLSICDLFNALAENDSSMCSMVKLVCELNATSTMEMDDLDFDIIINAYDRITADYFFGVSEDQALVILSHCIYDIKSDELILRQCAYKSLLSFVEFSALISGEEAKNQEVLAQKMAVDDSYWTDNHIQRIVNKFLLKHMGDAMSKGTTMQKEWIDLLHEMVLKLSGIPNLGSLKVLCSEDAEVDFFNNIVHLQKHRRARALSRFRNIVATGVLSEFMLKGVFIPLFFSMLYDLQAGKGEHIRNACLDAVASIAGQLGWKSYYALLMRCFKDMEKKLDREKVLLRLVCSILDQFHFSESFSSQDVKLSGNDVTENDPQDKPKSVLQPKCTSSTFSVIQACLTGTVLPKLQKLLVSDPQKVNVSISVAILKVLKKLPCETLDSHLSSIIHRIANFLKNRLQSIRDEARGALVACLKELGFEYLKLVVKVLSATLKRGFELHVLGYTLNFILSKGLSDSVGSVLDFCLDELLRAVDNDIFGEVAEQKEVEKVAFKMKETRRQMSFDTLKLIAQNVTFKSHGLKLLSPITAHMQKHLTPKVKLRLETMLTHIADGFEKNSSVNQTDLFIFIYGLIDDWLSQDKRARDTLLVEGSGNEKSTEADSKVVMKCYAGTEPQCSYLITVFALRLLHNRLKSIKLHKGNGQLLSLLDPFIKLLTSCLRSKYEEIVDVALRCLFPMTRLPLPSLESQADKIKVTLLDIAQSTSSVNSPVMQSCLKLLTALLHSTKITLSTDQLHILIQFPLFVDLEKNPSIVALTLLKAIVRRKLVVHEIYDLVNQVAELMVTSQEDAIRRKCSQILLQFLLNYQLSQKRRQQHLDFLVAHLRYEHATGRAAVLEMLKTIIKRFPEDIICEQSETFFLHLVLALANDHDNQVRSLIGIVIKQLIGRISSQPLDSILNICLSWFLGEKQQLWSPAAQVLGFVVEVTKRGFQKHINDVLPVIKMVAQSTIDVLNDGQLNLSDPETIPFWKDAYYSFILLEKILTQIPDLFFVGDIEDIWEAVSELLVHPHPWICNISSRLVALYFEQIGKQGKKIGTTCLTSTSRMFLIASSLCWRLKVQLPDKGARRLVKCNLAFSICGIQSLLHQSEFKDPCTFWSSLDPREQGCFLKACQLLDAKSGRCITEMFTCGFDDGNVDQKNTDLSYLLVSGLLNTMGKTALQTEDTQTKMILGSLRLVAEQTTQEDCRLYAYLLLFPIYKLCEGFAGKIVSDDVKQRAEKVRRKIQDTLGTQNFVQVYNQMRHDLGEKRFKRKQDEKLMAVINPVRNAKRKIRASAKHQAHKKRKMMAMKMGRWLR